MQWEFEAPGSVEADVGVPAGVVDVVDAADGKVSVTIQPLRSGKKADELLAAMDVSFSDGRLRVQVPEWRGRAIDVRCTVALPEGSVLSTRTASADVRCPVRLGRYGGTTASGDLALADVEGDVTVKAASGDLVCRQVGGRLEARSASGDVSVRRVAGDVHVSTASGDLQIGDAGASVHAETASGDVRIDRASTGRVQVSSASGDVIIGVATGVGAYLDVTTVTGDTRTTLPFTEEGAGDAVLEIACRTVSGDVSIRKAAS